MEVYRLYVKTIKAADDARDFGFENLAVELDHIADTLLKELHELRTEVGGGEQLMQDILKLATPSCKEAT